jgi:hypothetical protein
MPLDMAARPPMLLLVRALWRKYSNGKRGAAFAVLFATEARSLAEAGC